MLNIPQWAVDDYHEEEASKARPKPVTPQEYVAEINSRLKLSWLQSAVEIKDFNPPRDDKGAPQAVSPDKCEPMERFTFRADCWTSLDGEIVEGGVRIIYNAHREKRYPEDKAFLEFEPGQVASWDKLFASAKAFVRIANDRLHNYYKYFDDPKLLAKQKGYQTLMLADLTQPQRAHLAYRLDHNTCCGYLTACAVARGDHGDMKVKEIFEKYGCRSSRSAAILTSKVLKFRWL